MKRALLLLVGTAVLACNTEPDESIGTFGSSDTNGTSTTTTTSGGSTTDVASTGPGTSEATTGETSPTTDASTGMPVPVCGNGDVEGDEECDDGNESELDDCLTTCVVPTCDDGIQSGDESDVDCGGDTCAACSLCAACLLDVDCETNTCNLDKRCGFAARMEIDAEANCWSTTFHANDVIIPDVPAGTYLATAVQSGWTGFPPPWSPPSTGWTYYSECLDFEFTQLRTPGEQRYQNANLAFAALLSNTEMFSFPGGDMSCGRQDTACDDNMGTVIFDFELMCPDPNG